MKIKYNEIDKSIEIKDELRKHNFFLKITMISLLIFAFFRLLDINEMGIGFNEIISFLIGITCLVILYDILFKQSTSKKIPIEKIERLNEKTLLGKKRFSLKLKNGKKRDLTALTQTEFNELKKLFSEIGITS